MIIRPAKIDDMPQIKRLVDRAIGNLMMSFLTPIQVAGSFEFMGMDTQLLRDQTCFMAFIDDKLVGVGGWSYRQTISGGDHMAADEPAVLDPKTDAARICAIYTDPDFARRGIGAAIMTHCENAARQAGFANAVLNANKAGVPLYEKMGYVSRSDLIKTAQNGAQIPFVEMTKKI